MDKENNNVSNETNETSTNTGINQNTNAGNPNIDYGKIQEMLESRNARTEKGVLKDYFKAQGLSEEEVGNAITQYKNTLEQDKLSKENENKANTEALASLQKEIINKDMNLKAFEMASDLGIDLKTIPYLCKLVDVNNVVEDNHVSEDKLKTALETILEDIPQFKPKEEDRKGFIKVGADSSDNSTSTNVLSSIFGNNK